MYNSQLRDKVSLEGSTMANDKAKKKATKRVEKRSGKP